LIALHQGKECLRGTIYRMYAYAAIGLMLPLGLLPEIKLFDFFWITYLACAPKRCFKGRLCHWHNGRSNPGLYV